MRRSIGIVVLSALALVTGILPTAGANALPARAVTPQKIVGGSTAAISDAPWQIALVNRSEEGDYTNDLDAQYCGGSIISAQWILTAAHCAIDMSAFDIAVLSGTATLSSSVFSTSRISAVDQVFVHEAYDPELTTDDIALVRLETPLTLSDGVRQVIALPTVDETVGADLLVTGWGATDNDMSEYPQVLRKSVQDVLDPSECADFGDSFDSDTQVCVGVSPYNAIAACAGDSGGPAADTSGAEAVLVGLTSYGSTEGCIAGMPTSFTKVSAYLDWIDGIINSAGTQSVNAAQLDLEHAKVFPKTDGFRDTVRIAAIVESTGGPGVVEPLGAGSTVAIYKDGRKIASWALTQTGSTTLTWSGRRGGNIIKGNYTVKLVANGVDGSRVSDTSPLAVSVKKLKWVTAYKKVSAERLFQYEVRELGDNDSECRVEAGSLYMSSGAAEFTCVARKVVPAEALTSYANATLRTIVQVTMAAGTTVVNFGVDGATGAEHRIARDQRYDWNMGEMHPYFDEELGEYVVYPYITADPFTTIFVLYIKFGFTYRVLA